jgi:mono/diheme cytochrome c family protein
MTRRSGLVLLLVAAAVLAPGALVAYATPNGESAHATGIPGLPGFVGQKEENLKNVPGDPVKGLAVFRVFCSGCHNFKSSGLQAANKPGSDLDDRKPTYDKIVTLIAQGGGGGAFSRELLQDLTFDQIYDVAKYVAVYAGRPGPVKGASLQPPVPVELAAPLLDAQSAVRGHFTATLSGDALRWRIHVGNGANQPSRGRIRLGRQGGTFLTPVTLDCVRCFDEGSGFALLTREQAAAVASGKATVIVPAASIPNATIGALRGTIVPQS